MVKIGDRVRLPTINKMGTVRNKTLRFNGTSPIWVIELDKYYGTHSCSGKTKNGYGWYSTECGMEYICEPKKHIRKHKLV